MHSIREQFWSRGYAATSMDDLMSATGLGKGSLYGAFGGKSQLFQRVLDDYCAEKLDGMRQILKGPGTGLERLEHLFEGVTQGYTEDLTRRGCFLAISTSELHGQHQAVASRARVTYQEMQDLLTNCVRDAQVEGDVSAGVDPEEAGVLLLAVLQGIEFLAKTDIDADTLVRTGRSALSQLKIAV
ncbi:TetR/AcrR family transcriptional regulator [Streptomyces sp. NPDC015414]|uniref:TetR/AcrR family transcriptional regulator n=1 Tax=Streptomyces sp. NPDC015414 TaxID=3364957 RepID=UPI0036F4F7A7